MIANLHTLDTARSYADRIIGMAKGQVVFDGSPKELTDQRVLDVYGLEGSQELNQGITSHRSA